jgi:hypothetical protein
MSFILNQVCSAQDTMESLQRELDNAIKMKDSGIVLTIGGGILIGGSGLIFLIDLFKSAAGSFFSSIPKAGGSGTYDIDASTWGILIGGLLIGGCGVGFGVTWIVSGNAKADSAGKKMSEIEPQSEIIRFEPIAGFNPLNGNLSFGIVLHY